MKDTNTNYCQKCFSNPCKCNNCSCYDSYDYCDDIADIQTSLESILDSEASISECASRLFSCIFPNELDTIADTEKKVNLFSTLLLSYSNRACSLSKLIESINCFDENYVPNPHIDVFDTCSIPTVCDSKDCNEPSFKHSKSSPHQHINNLNPSNLCNTECKNVVYPKHICNGIYFLEKIKIYFSKCNTYKIFELYFNSNTQKLIYIKTKNSCDITKTYIF